MKIIGDVHGKIAAYKKLCEGYTLQLGDLSFSYEDMPDPTFHKFFGGNHDNYALINGCSNNIGDFGYRTHDETPFFFVRGAYSIDSCYRRQGWINGEKQSWWVNEELSLEEMYKALAEYEQCKPTLMITHTCPSSISEVVGSSKVMESYGLAGFNSKTNELLQMMVEVHKPALWVFGHFHKSWRRSIRGVEYICLDEFETYTI